MLTQYILEEEIKNNNRKRFMANLMSDNTEVERLELILRKLHNELQLTKNSI